MLNLNFWTTLVNLTALATAVWLGFYLATRSPRSLIAWLAAWSFWALSSLFLYASLITHLESAGVFTFLWQACIFVLPLWWHVTARLLPPRARQSRFWNAVNRFGIPLAYLGAFVLVVLGFSAHVLLLQTPTGSPLDTNYRAPGTFYPLFVAYSLLGSIPIGVNLVRARSHSVGVERAQYTSLLLATLLVGLGGLMYVLGTQFEWTLPVLLPDVLLLAGILFLGYAIARYSAFLEGRSIERDFLYTLLVVGSLTVFYASVVTILYLTGAVSFTVLALTVVGTVAANSLFDGARITFDRVFYQKRFQNLRANLRALAAEAGAGQSLNEQLQGILEALCTAFHIEHGFIAVRGEDEFVVRATYHGAPVGTVFAAEVLKASEILAPVATSRRPLGEVAILVPLFADGAQVGAMALGRRANAAAYQEADYELLEDLSDQMARVLYDADVQRANAGKINELVQDYRERERALQLQVQELIAERAEPPTPAPQAQTEEQYTALVEDALRHLHDYPYLGEGELAKLRVVERMTHQRADDAPVTFVDRGKAVSQLLVTLLNELKPHSAAPDPKGVAPREWHLYLVLHDAYVLEEPTREVMSRLYISEGTFNRTRRRALRALAKTLLEYEAAAQ